MARSADVGAERNAQHLHTVRPDENQSGLLDADDHQTQRYQLAASVKQTKNQPINPVEIEIDLIF